MDEHSRTGRTAWLEAAGVFCVALLVYALLPSRQLNPEGVRWLTRVEGAALPPPGGTNHLLSPLVPWLAWKLGAATGPGGTLTTEAALAVVRWAQLLNGALAAVGLLLLDVMLRRLGTAPWFRAFGALALGLSHAYLLNATEMMEPMSAVPWVMGALRVAQARGDSLAGRVLSGILVGVAGAFYMVALLAGLVVAALVAATAVKGRAWGQALLRMVSAGAAAALTFAGLVVVVNVGAGGASWAEATRAVWSLPDAGGVYGVFRLSAFGGALFGFAHSWAPLQEWRGARALLQAEPAVVAVNLALFLLGLVLLASLARALAHARHLWADTTRAAVAVGALAWLAATFVVAAYWDAVYEKLWLGGVTSVVLLAAVSVGQRGPWPGDARGRRRAVLLPLLTSWSLLLLFSAGVGGLGRHLRDNPHLRLAQALARQVGGSDLLVASGWDPTCIYLGNIIHPRVPCWSLADEAIAARLDAARVGAELRRAVRQTQVHHGQVLFLGLLQLGPVEWQQFLGSRLKLPYGLLGEYRQHAQVVARFSTGQGEVVVSRLGDVDPAGAAP